MNTGLTIAFTAAATVAIDFAIAVTTGATGLHGALVNLGAEWGTQLGIEPIDWNSFLGLDPIEHHHHPTPSFDNQPLEFSIE